MHALLILVAFLDFLSCEFLVGNDCFKAEVAVSINQGMGGSKWVIFYK